MLPRHSCYLGALQHADDVLDVILELVTNGERNVTEGADDVGLDVAVDFIRLQVLEQDLHDPVAVREQLVFNGATDVAEYTHTRLADLPLLRHTNKVLVSGCKTCMLQPPHSKTRVCTCALMEAIGTSTLTTAEGLIPHLVVCETLHEDRRETLHVLYELLARGISDRPDGQQRLLVDRRASTSEHLGCTGVHSETLATYAADSAYSCSALQGMRITCSRTSMI